jgi:hypothetical protein
MAVEEALPRQVDAPAAAVTTTTKTTAGKLNPT